MVSSGEVWASERCVHLEVPDGQMVAWHRAIQAASIAGVRELVPGSRSLQICVEVGENPEKVVAAVRAVVSANADPIGNPETRIIEIPVCYDTDLGPDLEQLAQDAGLTVGAAADLHARGLYTVRLVGFSPGFPYMDGLPELLHTSRLESPRTRVRAGSVGIAGSRTGIYPHATAGGWRLIGATPLRMFDPTRESPALLSVGEQVRFRKIDREEFRALEAGKG